jgi:preprotein translocase subunit YajC
MGIPTGAPFDPLECRGNGLGKWCVVDTWINFILLAQEAAGDPAPGAAGGGGVWALLNQLFVPFALIFALFYFMIVIPQRKEQERAKKLAAVKEKDHVLTTGGIYGVVTGVQPDTQRVTIRVDDSTGTKIKINMSAIAQILSDKEADSKD